MTHSLVGQIFRCLYGFQNIFQCNSKWLTDLWLWDLDWFFWDYLLLWRMELSASIVETLPIDLISRILDLMPAKDRARLSVVCKSYADISTQNWGRFTMLQPKALPDALAWMLRLAEERGQDLREMEITDSDLYGADLHSEPISPCPYCKAATCSPKSSRHSYKSIHSKCILFLSFQMDRLAPCLQSDAICVVQLCQLRNSPISIAYRCYLATDMITLPSSQRLQFFIGLPICLNSRRW